MAFLHPDRASVMPRMRVITQAQKKEQNVASRAAKLGVDPPPYDFQEYIGKGAYGLVFKCQNRKTNEICAVKILDTEQDYQVGDYYNREDSIANTVKEINALRALRELRAENINNIHDAFNFDHQIWIVSDYAAGGSLATLAKAYQRKGIDERFIIPITRQVLNGLVSIHRHGVIHRDLKCANILILESGEVQLCDFGVAGNLESNSSKRKTIVGTPFWMAPEISDELGQEDTQLEYGTEVDIWALGCTVYEMATGRPPFTEITTDPTMLGKLLRANPPNLDNTTFSSGLKSFILRCLQLAPHQRPSAAELAEDQYIYGTEDSYPNSIIAQVIEDYALFKASGGQRHSLFNAYGAQPDADPIQEEDDADPWNFSMSDDMDKRISRVLDQFVDESNGPLSITRAAPGMQPSVMQQIYDNQVRRGEGRLAGLFQLDRAAYDGQAPVASDLPLRNDFMSDRAGSRETMIDLDDAIDFGGGFNLNMYEETTLKARRSLKPRDHSSDRDSYNSSTPWRQTQEFQLSLDPPPEDPNRRTQDWTFAWATQPAAEPVPSQRSARPKTQDWKFPSAEDMQFSADPSESEADEAPFRPPPLRHAATMPAPRRGRESPDRSSMIDLDDIGMGGLELEIPTFTDYSARPSTAGTDSAISEATDGDPFDLEEHTQPIQGNRTSFHMKSQSEPTAGLNITEPASKDPSVEEGAQHTRSSSMTGSKAVPSSHRDSRESQLSRSSEVTITGIDGTPKPKTRSRRPTGLTQEPDPSQFVLNPTTADSSVPPLPTNGINTGTSRRGPSELNDFVFNARGGFGGAQGASARAVSRSRGSNDVHQSDRDSGGDTINTLRPHRFRSRTRGLGGSKGSISSIGSYGNYGHLRQESTSSSASASTSARQPLPHLFPGRQSHMRQQSQQSSGSSSFPASLSQMHIGPTSQVQSYYPQPGQPDPLAPGNSPQTMWNAMRPMMEALPAKNAALTKAWKDFVEKTLPPGALPPTWTNRFGVSNGAVNGIHGSDMPGMAS